MGKLDNNCPGWVLLHLPHDSTQVPNHVRNQFCVSDSELEGELSRMTDHFTGDLFCPPDFTGSIIRCPVSRLVLDVERFPDDAQEIMSSRGMGAVYTRTAHGQPLRHDVTAQQRRDLLDEFYWPHHHLLTQATEKAFQRHGQALILDAHSFPSRPLPYELDQNSDRPEICIGTDAFHTPDHLRDAFLETFAEAGFGVRLNAPFSGALVPSHFYRQNARIWSIMIEINRGLYMDESTGERLESFAAFAARVQRCCRQAVRLLKARMIIQDGGSISE